MRKLPQWATSQAQKPATPVDTFVVIGPSGVGKTNLVAALYVASNKVDRKLVDDGITVDHVKITPRSADMDELIKQFAKIAKIGSPEIPGTRALTNYEFGMEVRWSDAAAVLPWNRKQARSVVFHMLDGPGGALFDGEGADHIDDKERKEFQVRLIAEVQRAKGVMLCVDSTNPEAAIQFFEDLPGIFHQAVRLGPLRGERFVVCLTKADAQAPVVNAGGKNSLRALERLSTSETARELLTEFGVTILKRELPETCIVRAGFTSIYGFLDTGQVNFNGNEGARRLLVYPEKGSGISIADAVRAWTPYRILDPFIFLATGLEMNLEPLW